MVDGTATDGGSSEPPGACIGTGAQPNADASPPTSSNCRLAQGPAGVGTPVWGSDLLRDWFSKGGHLSSDGQYLYMNLSGSLYRIPTLGGSAEALYSGPPDVGTFYAAAGTVAWTVLTPDGGSAAGLMVANAEGVQSVALPDGVQLSNSLASQPIVDWDGNVYFEATPATGGMSHAWRWSPASNSVAEVPGVGRPETGADTDLYAADRGQIVWLNEIDSPAGGIYVTELSTGASWQLTDNSAVGFGTLIGLDANNLYGVTSTLVYSHTCGALCPYTPLTVYGVARDGCGTPFVAYETADVYQIADLHADDSGVYWLALNPAGFYHAALVSGATAEPLLGFPLAGVARPGSFAMDGCNLYWAEGDPFAPTPYIGAIPK